MSGGLQTEFEFFLPKGFVDDDGTLHRVGTMRLATARDELDPLRDPRVRDADDPFLTILVLSRVITRLGSLTQITAREIENLFAADLAYLQDVYGAINFGSQAETDAVIADAEARSSSARAQTRAAVAEPEDATSDDEESRGETNGDVPTGRRRHVEEVGRR